MLYEVITLPGFHFSAPAVKLERPQGDDDDGGIGRQAAESTVAADLLQSYQGLRQSRRGLAVAEVAENACSACGTVLTSALQQNARHAAQLVITSYSIHYTKLYEIDQQHRHDVCPKTQDTNGSADWQP